MPASYLGHLSAVSLQMAQVQQELSMSEPDPPPGAEDEAAVQGNGAAPAPALKLPKWLQEWAQGVVPSQDTVEQAAGTILSREQPVKGRARESITVGRRERAARRGAQAAEREDEEEGLTRLGGERTSSMLPYSPEPAEPGPLPFLSHQLLPQGSLPPLSTGRAPAGQDVLREVQQERAAAFEEFRMRTRQQQPQQQQQQQMRPYQQQQQQQQQQQLGGAPHAGAMHAPRRASEPVRPCYNPVLPPPSLSRYIPPVFVAPAPSPSSAQEGSSARMQGTSASGSVQDTSEGVEGDAAEDEQMSEAIIDEEESSEDSVEVTRRSRRRGKGTRTAKSLKAADAGAAFFMPRQRAPTQRARPAGGTSKRKGVTRHRHTLRWEAHLWDNSAPRSQEKNALTGAKKGRTRGKQVYLGGFASETEAARAYDRAAIVYYGPKTQLNGKITDYAAELDTLKKLSRQEVVAMLRKSSGFSRGLACQPFADSD